MIYAARLDDGTLKIGFTDNLLGKFSQVCAQVGQSVTFVAVAPPPSDWDEERTASFYREYNANVHRGIHTLSMRATFAYEDAVKQLWPVMGYALKERLLQMIRRRQPCA